MNNTHYPSLELCKELTEAWFSETEKWFYSSSMEIARYIENHQCYKCPSVMELLDEMPWEIETEIPVFLNISMLRWATVSYDDNWLKKWSVLFSWTLPNALAEMWLWLKENNYLKHD